MVAKRVLLEIQAAAPDDERSDAICETPTKKPRLVPEITPEKQIVLHGFRLRSKTGVIIGLSDEQRTRVKRKALDISKQGNTGSVNYARVGTEGCRICSAERHSRAWMYRYTGFKKTQTIGRICYSCWKSCGDLDIPRCADAIRAFPDIRVVVCAASHRQHQRLSKEGTANCRCHICSSSATVEG